jgi:hypothetical protein
VEVRITLLACNSSTAFLRRILKHDEHTYVLFMTIESCRSEQLNIHRSEKVLSYKDGKTSKSWQACDGILESVFGNWMEK